MHPDLPKDTPRHVEKTYRVLKSTGNGIKNSKKRDTFRYKDENLAKNTGYSPRAVCEARKKLREMGMLSWDRTGRSNIYRVHPDGSGNDGSSDVACGPDQQPVPIGSEPIADRNREPKRATKGEHSTDDAETEDYPSSRGRTNKQYKGSLEVTDAVMDFTSRLPGISIYFDTNQYGEKFGVERLKAEFGKLPGSEQPMVDADMETGEVYYKSYESDVIQSEIENAASDDELDSLCERIDQSKRSNSISETEVERLLSEVRSRVTKMNSHSTSEGTQ